MKAKWAKLSVAVFGVGSVMHVGCLGLGSLGGGDGGFFGGFVDGIFGRGFPTDNLWLNIGIDVLNEELFG